jgi:hypothetical protein
VANQSTKYQTNTSGQIEINHAFITAESAESRENKNALFPIFRVFRVFRGLYVVIALIFLRSN